MDLTIKISRREWDDSYQVISSNNGFQWWSAGLDFGSREAAQNVVDAVLANGRYDSAEQVADDVVKT